MLTAIPKIPYVTLHIWKYLVKLKKFYWQALLHAYHRLNIFKTLWFKNNNNEF